MSWEDKEKLLKKPNLIKRLREIGLEGDEKEWDIVIDWRAWIVITDKKDNRAHISSFRADSSVSLLEDKMAYVVTHITDTTEDGIPNEKQEIICLKQTRAQAEALIKRLNRNKHFSESYNIEMKEIQNG